MGVLGVAMLVTSLRFFANLIKGSKQRHSSLVMVQKHVTFQGVQLLQVQPAPMERMKDRDTMSALGMVLPANPSCGRL